MSNLKLYNTKEAAEMLSMSEQALRRKIRLGEVKAIKIGTRKYGIPQSVLEDLLTPSSHIDQDTADAEILDKVAERLDSDFDDSFRQKLVHVLALKGTPTKKVSS